MFCRITSGVGTDFDTYVRKQRVARGYQHFDMVGSDLVAEICVGSPCQHLKLVLDTTTPYIEVVSTNCLHAMQHCRPAQNGYDYRRSISVSFRSQHCFDISRYRGCDAILTHDTVSSAGTTSGGGGVTRNVGVYKTCKIL